MFSVNPRGMICEDKTLNLRKGSRPLTRKIVGSCSDLQSIFWFVFMKWTWFACRALRKNRHTSVDSTPLALFRIPQSRLSPSPVAELTAVLAVSAVEIILAPSSLVWVGQLNYAFSMPRLLSKSLLVDVQSSERNWVWSPWPPSWVQYWW